MGMGAKMNLADKIKKIKGLRIKYANGQAQVLEHYDNDTIMVRLDKGVKFTALEGDPLAFVLESDGTDIIIVKLEEILRYN